MRRAVSAVGFVQVLGVAALFGFHLALARWMPAAEDYGVFAFYFGAANVGQVLAGFGLPIVIMREYGRFEGSGRHGAVRSMLRAGRRLLVATSGAAGLLWLSTAPLVPAHERGVWLAAGASAVCTPWLLHAANQAKAQRRPVLATTLERVLRPLIALAIAGQSVLSRGMSTATAMLGWFASTLGVAILGLGLTERGVPEELDLHDGPLPPAQLMRVAGPMVVASGIGMLLANVDVLMLRPAVGDAAVGTYSVAVRVSLLTGLPLMAINVLAAPFFARQWGSGDMRALQAGARQFVRIGAPAAVIGGAAIIMATPLLPMVFGESYDPGRYLVATLVVAQCVHALAGSTALLLNMTGHERPAVRILGLALVADVILNLVLIPPLGVHGAAIATAACTVGWNIAAIAYMRRAVGVDTSVLALVSDPKQTP